MERSSLATLVLNFLSLIFSELGAPGHANGSTSAPTIRRDLWMFTHAMIFGLEPSFRESPFELP